jgi:hypothetical protein
MARAKSTMAINSRQANFNTAANGARALPTLHYQRESARHNCSLEAPRWAVIPHVKRRLGRSVKLCHEKPSTR